MTSVHFPAQLDCSLNSQSFSGLFCDKSFSGLFCDKLAYLSLNNDHKCISFCFSFSLEYLIYV